MENRPRSWTTLLLVTGLAVSGGGCGNADIEGDEPNECSDGADNDRDGDFDCDDSDCAGSPACGGPDAGAGDGGGGGVATWKQLTSGGVHGCGIQDDDTVHCWGGNAQGQSVPTAGAFTETRVSFFHSCGVGTDGTVSCWGCKGDKDFGQCEAPVLTSIAHVATGTYSTCVTDSAGTARCWGCLGADHGQCAPPTEVFEDLAAGSLHACGLVGGLAVCWGNDEYGQASPPATGFTRLSAGTWHTCGIDADDDSIVCWGCDSPAPDQPADFGQCDAPAGAFKEVAAGVYHTCGVTLAGAIVCWGCIGEHDGSATDTGQCDPPQAGSFDNLGVGKYHGCALRADRRALCWGNNYFGQLDVP